MPSWSVGCPGLFLLGIGQSLYRPDHWPNPCTDHILEGFGCGYGELHYRNKSGRLYCHTLFDGNGYHRWRFFVWNKYRTVHHISPEAWCHQESGDLFEFTILWGFLGCRISRRAHFPGSNNSHTGYHYFPGVFVLRTTLPCTST